MFYGIKTNTLGLSRNAGSADVAAYYYLQPRIDVAALAEIEQARVPPHYFKSFDLALRAARVYDGVVISYMGAMSYPDLAAEMADLLLRLEEADWVICAGVYQDVLIVSVRTREPRHGDAGATDFGATDFRGDAGATDFGAEQPRHGDAGATDFGDAGATDFRVRAREQQHQAEQLVQAIVGAEGTAGGHGTMAGGQIPLTGKNRQSVVSQLVSRTLQHLKIEPGTRGKPLF